jgi:hypothetical protein
MALKNFTAFVFCQWSQLAGANQNRDIFWREFIHPKKQVAVLHGIVLLVFDRSRLEKLFRKLPRLPLIKAAPE